MMQLEREHREAQMRSSGEEGEEGRGENLSERKKLRCHQDAITPLPPICLIVCVGSRGQRNSPKQQTPKPSMRPC